MIVEASVIIMKRGITKKLSGVRVQKMEDGDWQRTWAFSLKEKTASREGYSQTQIHGSLRKTDDYPGRRVAVVKDSISVINATKWFVGIAQTQMLSVRGVEHILL